jgi:mannose-1-phosphate guanylyltransferase
MQARLRELSELIGTPEFETRLDAVWNTFPALSIDYLLMEGAQNMAVIPVDIGWSDVGSWDSLFGVLRVDKFGNCFKVSGPDPTVLDTHGTMV